MFKYCFEKGLFWVRVFGIGFKIKNTAVHPLLFSERNKRAKGVIVGKFYIVYLPLL